MSSTNCPLCTCTARERTKSHDSYFVTKRYLDKLQQKCPAFPELPRQVTPRPIPHQPGCQCRNDDPLQAPWGDIARKALWEQQAHQGRVHLLGRAIADCAARGAAYNWLTSPIGPQDTEDWKEYIFWKAGVWRRKICG